MIDIDIDIGVRHLLPMPFLYPSTPSVSRCRLGAYGASVLRREVRLHQKVLYNAYVVREEGARMIFLQGGRQFEVTPVSPLVVIISS